MASAMARPLTCEFCGREASDGNPIAKVPSVDALTGRTTGRFLLVCRECYDRAPVERDPPQSSGKLLHEWDPFADERF